MSVALATVSDVKRVRILHSTRLSLKDLKENSTRRIVEGRTAYNEKVGCIPRKLKSNVGTIKAHNMRSNWMNITSNTTVNYYSKFNIAPSMRIISTQKSYTETASIPAEHPSPRD